MERRWFFRAASAAGLLLWSTAALAQMDTAWVRRYNGPGNSNDDALALRVDAVGNVYVTGYSFGGSTGYDYATLKYGPTGNLVWTRRYNGLGNGYDWANALDIDTAGNVCVTGFSDGGSSGWDYATLKYDPNGTLLWERRYDGPGDSTDVAAALRVDESGNVYVTGKTWDDTANCD